MKQRTIYAIVAIIALFGLGAGLDFGISTESNLRAYAKRIEKSLHKKEFEVQAFFADTGFIYRQLRGIERLPSPQQQADLAQLLTLTKKHYNIRLYQGDSLVYWLNNRAFLSKGQASEILENPLDKRLLKLSNGYFELIKKRLPGSADVTAMAMIPIKWEYARESEFLPNGFVTDDFLVPSEVLIRESGKAFAIKNSSGTTLAYLDAKVPVKNKSMLKIVFAIYLLGFIAVGVLVNDVAVLLVEKYKPWVGAAFMLTAVVLIRAVIIKLGFTKHFASFQTFTNVFTVPIMEGVNSLGELLINIMLLVWMMVFFNREFQVKQFVHPSPGVRFGLATLNYFSVSLGILMICSIFKSIILDSSIVFDFENVFNLNSQSVLAMVGVVMLLLALFLFSHRMIMAIHKLGLDRYPRMGAMLLALGGSLPVMSLGNLHMAPYYFLIGAFIYLVVLEMFAEVRQLSLQWLIGWLCLFASLTAMLLYKYNGDKDYVRREAYAKALASYKDAKAEEQFWELGKILTSDSALVLWRKIGQFYKQGNIPKEEVRDIVDAQLGLSKYLLHNYDFDLFGFYQQDASVAFKDQTVLFGEMESQFQQADPTKFEMLRFKPEKTRDPGYLLRLSIPAGKPLTVFIFFKRSFSTPSKVYTELLLDKKYKDLDELDSYDYGIYQDGRLVEERNKAYGKQLTDSLPPVGQIRVVKHYSTRSELLYHAPNHIAIKIGRETGGYIKPISLFSYVFTMLTIAVLVLSGLNYFTNALPGPLNFFRNTRPSLRNQFQYWIIGMILFSFLSIGAITVWYFQRSSNEYHKGRLDRKVTSALANVNYEIKAWHKERQRDWEKGEAPGEENGRKLRIKIQATPKEMEVLENEDLDAFSLSSLIPLISEVHRLDVNIYDLDGNLITSSEEDIFKGGIVSSKMGAYAFQALTRLGYERRDQDESIGTLDYTAAYMPLKDLEGKTLAFMGIPYYARHRELRSEVTDFMSTLLNVYVLLLLIASGVAILVVGSTTKALTNLVDNLQRLRLGRNDPIVWKRKDEIGMLVEAYNGALKQIEESSVLLAQSERDSAWREMAKQVAHEIKNPLTPMKLSIQYLLHAYQSNPDPDSIGPLIKRVSNTLVEQIESLAQIATEFSNFAKMPKAQNSLFSLNDLAASVHHLFKNESPDVDITIDLPEKDFEVFADRNHLTRVINNLLKNAIQAIPDDRRGLVQLSLYEQADKLVLRVMDNGTGIPPEIREKVFTPNFSTKNSGTGLGLAICKSIIEGFNGDIYFETEMDKGTKFYVVMPLAGHSVEKQLQQA